MKASVKNCFLSILAIAVLSGCSHTTYVNAIKIDQMNQVVSEIKRQVGDYQKTVNAYKSGKLTDPANKPLDPACKSKVPLEFTITAVKMELTTTLDNTLSGGVGFTIPVASLAGTASPSLTASAEETNTQSLTFYAYPQKNTDDTPPTAPSVITQTLVNFRSALIAASVNAPCFDTTQGSKVPDDTFSMAITVVSQVGDKFELKLAVIDASIGGNLKSVTGNTITFTFQPTTDSSFALPDKLDLGAATSP